MRRWYFLVAIARSLRDINKNLTLLNEKMEYFRPMIPEQYDERVIIDEAQPSADDII